MESFDLRFIKGREVLTTVSELMDGSHITMGQIFT